MCQSDFVIVDIFIKKSYDLCMDQTLPDAEKAKLIKERYDKYISDLNVLKMEKLKIISKYRRKIDDLSVKKTKEEITSIYNTEDRSTS